MYEEDELRLVFKLSNTRVVNDNLMSTCPFAKQLHKDGTDNYPSFGINLHYGNWHCFTCKERGTTIRTLAYKLNIMLPDSLMMASLVVAPPIRDEVISYKTYDIRSISTESDKFAYEALKDRGIGYPAIRRFRVGYLHKTGSIQFPCILPDGNMYGWIERNSLWDGRYGYKPVGVVREKLLFGLDRKITKGYLVESMTDALKLITFHTEAISTCGNMIFEEQAKLLSTYCDKIVLVPQRDGPAKSWLRDAEKYLRGLIPVSGVAIRQGFKDVGEAGYTKQHWEEDKKSERFLY